MDSAVSRSALARREYDAGHDFLVSHAIGRRDHRDLPDCRMAGEGRFDFQRGDVLAGAADDVLAPVDEVQAAIRPAAHAVAGVEPATAPGIGGGRLVLE